MAAATPPDRPDPARLIARSHNANAAEGDGAKAPVVLVGTVEQGVEARSVVLLDDDGAVLAQLGGKPSVRYPFGTRVRVRGNYLTGLRTTTQQGRPFRVDELIPE